MEPSRSGRGRANLKINPAVSKEDRLNKYTPPACDCCIAGARDRWIPVVGLLYGRKLGGGGRFRKKEKRDSKRDKEDSMVTVGMNL